MMETAIAIGALAVWLIGSGVRSAMRKVTSDFRWEALSDSPAPIVNLFWPVELVARLLYSVPVRLVLVLPIRTGMWIEQRRQAKQSQLPGARVVRRP